MKAVVIGATGHTGSYMVPALVRRGYEVVAISRGGRQAYTKDCSEWKSVQTVIADRKPLEADGSFGRFIMSFNPDVICDLICYTMPQAVQIAEAAAGHVRHLIQIGSVWAYGYAATQPTRESDRKNPLDDYGRCYRVRFEVRGMHHGQSGLHRYPQPAVPAVQRARPVPVAGL